MSQKEFWNGKFSKDGYLYGLKPNSFIEEKTKVLKSEDTQALCLGEGEGRNAIFLAQKGFEVTAIDASNIGLEKLEKRAKQNKLDIKTQCLDLNDWEVTKKYKLIVASYLHMYKNERKSLFEKIEKALEKDGYFIGEFFCVNQLNYSSGGPKDKELLYEVEDFQKEFLSCKKEIKEELIELDEGKGHQGKASVIRVLIQKN